MECLTPIQPTWSDLFCTCLIFMLRRHYLFCIPQISYFLKRPRSVCYGCPGYDAFHTIIFQIFYTAPTSEKPGSVNKEYQGHVMIKVLFRQKDTDGLEGVDGFIVSSQKYGEFKVHKKSVEQGFRDARESFLRCFAIPSILLLFLHCVSKKSWR